MSICQPVSIATETRTDPVMLIVHSDRQCLRLKIGVDRSLRQALDATELRVRAACGGQGGCGACLIQTIQGEFSPPTLAERQKIPPEELANGMRLACQLHALGDGEVYLPHPAPHSEWKSLNSGDLYQAAVGNPDLKQRIYGVAVDLGTTHIRLSLWNRQSGTRIASRYCLNPQIAHGADVLTRLAAMLSQDREQYQLSGMVRKALLDGIRDILIRDVGEVSPMLAKIGEVLIVGNTAMLTLICGNHDQRLYQPEYWQQTIDCEIDDAAAWQSAWQMPDAAIRIAQPLAGFIGSDLLADLAVTGICEQPQPMLLVDFGTNTEIALWDGNRLLVTSAPGGPAFECAGMSNGMAAEDGAICQVQKIDDHWQITTIDDGAPRGFCGSGFIDTIACLLTSGVLKPSGRFTEATGANGYRLQADNPRSAIYSRDVDIFQRAKASSAAAMQYLLGKAGLSVTQLQRLWICGSFGEHLNLSNAQLIGVLPEIDPAKIHLFANASLAGCEKLLLADNQQTLLTAIAAKTQVVNLGGVAEYEDQFIDNLRLQPLIL